MPNVKVFNLTEEEAVSAASNPIRPINAVPFLLDFSYGFSAMLTVTTASADLVANAKIQVSNDKENWIDIPGSQQYIDNDTVLMWTISETMFKWGRIVGEIQVGTAVYDGNVSIKSF